MATKNLARTVIEGGRRNVYERRHSHREERADTRQFVAKVMKGMDADELPTPRIRPVKPEFSDKLTPARRWMTSRSGKLWSEVKSELHRKFEGPWPTQHVVYVHMLRDVMYSHEPNVVTWRHRYEFVVTPDGVFHKPVRGPSRYPNNRRRLKERFTYRSTDRVKAWLKDRRVEESGGVFYWVTPVTTSWEKCTNGHCELVHHSRVETVRTDTREYQKGRDHTGYALPYKRMTVNYHVVALSYRRSGKLSERELQYWKTLHSRWKAIILEKKPI